jgi:hypothetical protein
MNLKLATTIVHGGDGAVDRMSPAIMVVLCDVIMLIYSVKRVKPMPSQIVSFTEITPTLGVMTDTHIAWATAPHNLGITIDSFISG